MIAAVLLWFVEVNMFNENFGELIFFYSSSVPKNSFVVFIIPSVVYNWRKSATMGLQFVGNTSIDVCCCGGLN